MYGEKILDITVFRAQNLKDVDRMGGNDAYVFAFIDLDDPKVGAKTAVADKGKNPVWNQQLHIEQLNDRTEYLYIEVMDDETGADEPIGFTAIPLSQVRDAPGQRLQGRWNLFDEDGKQQKGEVILGLRLRDRSDLPQEEEEGPLVDGVGQVVSLHQKRYKSLVKRENMEDAAKVAGVALASGALLAKKFGLFGKSSAPKKAHEQ